MAAVLFLVGQGLEDPSVIDDLLDIATTPARPQYEMADDAPLVLWDCIFPREGADGREDALEWVYVGEGAGGAGRHGIGGLVDEVWRVWRGRKMDEVLGGCLLDVVGGREGGVEGAGAGGTSKGSQRVFQGGDGARFGGVYVPLMRKARMESVEKINARYAERKGFERREEVREMGFRRLGADERE